MTRMHYLSLIILFALALSGCGQTPPELTATPKAPVATPATVAAIATPTSAPATKPAAPLSTPTSAPATKPPASPSPASPAKPPIKIGVLITFTGPMATWGPQVKGGISLALDEVNGQAEGRKFEVIYEDTEGTPAVALTKAKKLVEKDGVQILMGVGLTPEAYALRDYVVEQKMPLMITGAAQAIDLTRDPKLITDYIFRTSFSGTQTGGVPGFFAYKYGFRKAVRMASDIKPGHELGDEFQRVFTKMGGSVVQDIWVPPGTADFAPYLTKVKVDQADLLWQFFTGADAIRFVKQADEYGVSKKLRLMMHGFEPTPSTLQELGDSGIGIFSTWPWVETLDNPANQQFVKAYRAKYGEPAPASEQTYTAGKAMLLALQKTGGNIEDRAQFIAALKQVDFAAPRGRFRFDKFNNPIQTMYNVNIAKVDGKLTTVVDGQVPDVDQFWSPQ